jgi:hypothetical protein
MTSFKQTLLVFILLIIAQFSFGQVTLYNEDFAGEVGKGVIGPVAYTYDTVGMAWTIDVSATSLTEAADYFKVNASEQFESKDVDGEAIWYSPSIDISTVASVDLSVDLAETSVVNNTEYIRVYYSVDGGTETLFSTNGDNTNTFGSVTATQDSLIGTTLQIIIRTSNNAGTKTHTFDNITVIENISNVQGLYDLPEVGSINLNWSNPASDFDEVLVVGNEGSAITAGLPTGDGTAYTANPVLGSGTSLLGGTVLYKGTGNTNNFTGVTTGNTYYVKVFTRKGTSWSKGYAHSIIYSPPGAGDILITEYARHATISDYSYIELYNTTSSDISLAGAKMIVNNASSLSEVVDLSTDISGSIIVPANGFLILNRNRSQANFETTWGVTLASTGYTVNYNRTAINNFGNDKEFVLKMGGTVGIDDGTIIDETKEFTSALGKRVFQLPKGYWAGNIDDAATYATPGSFYVFENMNNIQMAYSDGAWHAETGYAFTEPSASTGATAAVIVRGNATITDGSVLNVLGIWPDAGTSITTETITINTGLYLANNASLAITSTGAVSCAGEISITRNGYNLATDYNAWGTPFSTSLPVDSIFTDHNPCDFYVFKATDQSWKHDYTIGSSVTCTGNTSTIIAANVIESPEGTPDGNFDIARGYFIVGNTSNEYDFRIASGGTLNNGSITANIYGSSAGEISGSNDWNLISNPYPSALDADLFLTTNSSIIENALYLYNPGNGIDSTVSYTTINNTDGAHIASCQGFYVNANTATDGLIGTVSFTNSMRTNQNDNFRSFDSFSGVYLNVTNEKNTTDQTRLYFDRDCEDGRDRKFDAVKMENSGFNFGSKLGDDIMVFNGLKELTTQTKVIPLYFQTTQKSVYSISLDSLLGDMNNKDILLEDRFMRKFHDLRGQDYSFLSDAKEWKNRFFIHIVEQKRNNGSGTGPITGVDEVNRNEVKVFQTGEEIIISSNIEELNQVELMTINGKRISSYNVNGNTHSINITSLTIGIYLVRYQLNNGAVETQKIVIQ